ncbi:hypothetical protein AB0G74_04415 [Streptomyces sp. NPDC020875]|uniref:hypothetical protein n=1 Tax=Streptomyces sp. NPDC020875 TaxID=3154898 RepID=UPI0033C79197
MVSPSDPSDLSRPYSLTLAGTAIRRPVDGAVWVPLWLRRDGRIVEATGAAIPPERAIPLAHQILKLTGGDR